MTTALADLVRPEHVQQGQSQELAPTWKWLVLVAGAILLAAGPAAPRALDVFSISGSAGWAMALCVGFAISSAIAPALVLAICATLSWRPAWQRCLLFAPIFALQFVSYGLFWCDADDSPWGRTVLLLSPLAIMAAASPAFLLRLWRQWVLVPRGNPVRPRPASIVSFLLATTCWAAAAACTQWISRDGGGLWGDMGLQDEPGLEALAKLVSAVIFLLIPGFFAGLSLALSLRTALLPSLRRACLMTCAVGIATLAIAVGSIVSFVRLTFRVNDGPPSSNDLLGAALGVGSFWLTMLAVGLASACVLRLLGYRLIHRRSLLESR